jgi:hypothetical protein
MCRSRRRREATAFIQIEDGRGNEVNKTTHNAATVRALAKKLGAPFTALDIRADRPKRKPRARRA